MFFAFDVATIRRFPVSRLTSQAVNACGHQMRRYDSTRVLPGRRGLIRSARAVGRLLLHFDKFKNCFQLVRVAKLKGGHL
jgi:hypothetical protein